MKFIDLFKRKKYASPYYGGQGALFNSSAMPLRKLDDNPEPKAPNEVPKRVATQSGPDWERRRFELVEKLILQGRLSVILGKTQATDEQIAAKSRHVADAAIKELQLHPYKSHEADKRRDSDDE